MYIFVLNEKTAGQEQLCLNRKDVGHHKIMKRWTVVICAIVVAVLCWHPVGHVCCSEQRLAALQAQGQPTQDTSRPQDPSDQADTGQTVELSTAQETVSPSEPSVLTEGGHVEEEAWTLDHAETGNLKQTTEVMVRADEPVLEWEVVADPKQDLEPPVPEPQGHPEQQQQQHYSTATSEPAMALPASPAMALPASPSINPDGKASPSSPTALESAADSAIESLVADPSTPPVSSTDSPPTDCEAIERPSYSDVLTDLPVLENTSTPGGGKGTSTKVDASAVQSGQGSNTSSHLQKDKGMGGQIAKEVDSSAATKDPEDIPTFDEWKKKMMEVEIEKSQTTHTSSNGATHVAKKVQNNLNNYASVECGAKILSANPEAKSTSAILMENMDLYMLNPCSNKIWFVIELCEPIQVKKLDIANFELFSSTPKDFLVSISDRYPTNKWVKLGTFHGHDERTIQSFPLDEHLFAKYVKVELLSHFGSEHFCPLSLIRVFGTSMVEEYEDEISDPLERTDIMDDDEDYPPGYVPSEAKSSNNIIGSAKDAILNMVNNIADKVLGGSPDGRDGNGTASAVNASGSAPAAQISPTTASSSPQIETTEISETGMKELPTTSTQETPTEEALTPEETAALQPSTPVIATPAPSEVNPIVILLPADDLDPSGGPGTDSEDSGVLREATSWEHTDARLQESSIYCEEYPSSSSCCLASLQEHLLKQCSALLALRRLRKRTTERLSDASTSSSSSSSASAVSSEQQSVSPTSPSLQEDSKPTKDLSSSPIEESSPPEQPPTVPVVQPVVDPLGLAPSLAPSLSEAFSADPPSHKATPAIDLSESSVSDTRAEGSEETEAHRRRTPAPSSTASSSLSATTTVQEDVRSGEDTTMGPAEVDQPGAEAKGSSPAPSSDVLEQAASLPAQPSASTEPPSHPGPEDHPPGVPEELPPSPPSTEASDGLVATGEPRLEDLLEEAMLGGSAGMGQLPVSGTPSSSLEMLSEMVNATEVAGGGSGQGHGSGQKESVFMRLNNRIKALEMNMSLSGRYLEQLSQRYRKQMEEMQKAFNKTIIKLQNTSKVADEQDQKQTESILTLQGQLENVTELVLNLSVRISQLQTEVSDRQSYLLLCLVLCLLLGLVLFINHCRLASIPPTAQPDLTHTSSYTYCCPEGSVPGCDDLGLKRSASYPLLQRAFQIPTTEGPADAYNVETSRNPLLNKKQKKRCKKKVETLSAVVVPSAALPLANGGPQGGLQPPVALRDGQSEGSSEGSSHSDEPSFCGVAASCRRLCDSLPPQGRTRAERRAYKRRRSKPTGSSGVVELLQAPRRRSDPVLSGGTGMTSLQDLMKGKKEMSAGTLGAMAISGPT
ncbi:SUN domain-containing ossification factor-like isoform X3 [Alosa sapidissima]|uniref:SUN domain-containing ossification factor-like isoform X3 n=1 Tax=Alosa sapidissima TaxID=34773 RepID=UPI001C08943F|nr:SUN domain-containing ossification factor-like isoform X3 [Alosa sapidissima]